ncbi:MAG: MBL fold metallo-hydrolase [Tannerellaceae bacterium]|nr:MBL fold metallo-hydrolase [Tannerellaceae bacterium]
MKLTVLGSGSAGNCYILENQREDLIIEAGIRLQDVKKALRFNVSKIAGCLISHEHGDHALYYREFLSGGFPVLSPKAVYQNKGCDVMPPWAKVVFPKKGYKVGGFNIVPFDVKHDVPCLGFMVEHVDMGRLLFVTDTMMLEYTFPVLNHILLEANYSDEILGANIESGKALVSTRRRLMDSHMELGTAKEILRSNNLSEVLNIVLLHLSDHNSNEEQFVREIKEVTGKPVYAADKGLELIYLLNHIEVC